LPADTFPVPAIINCQPEQIAESKGICKQVFAFSKLTFCSEGEGGGERESIADPGNTLHIVSKKKTKEAPCEDHLTIHSFDVKNNGNFFTIHK
jgi:hypothetical protein